MPFYRRKAIIIPLAIIVSFLAWLSYLWTVESYRPSLKQTQALTKVADQVHAFMKQNNLRAMGIKSGAVLPEPLRGDPFIKTLPTDITRANRKIERVSFSYRCQPECYFTAYFFIDMPSAGTIGPYRYFQYNPNGYQEHMPEYPAQSRLTEHKQYNWFGWTEEFVPSIAEALKEDVGYVYFFCEPLEQEHWHFCRGKYD